MIVGIPYSLVAWHWAEDRWCNPRDGEVAAVNTSLNGFIVDIGDANDNILVDQIQCGTRVNQRCQSNGTIFSS